MSERDEWLDKNWEEFKTAKASSGILDYLRRKTPTRKKILARFGQAMAQLASMVDFFERARMAIEEKTPRGPKSGEEGRKKAELDHAKTQVIDGERALQVYRSSLNVFAAGKGERGEAIENKDVDKVKRTVAQIHTRVTQRTRVILRPVGKDDQVFKRDMRKFAWGLSYLFLYVGSWEVKQFSALGELNPPSVVAGSVDPCEGAVKEMLNQVGEVTDKMGDIAKDAFEGGLSDNPYVVNVIMQKTRKGTDLRKMWGLTMQKQTLFLEGKEYRYV